MQIMAGQFKGRKLLPPKGRRTTRPITGLARKSLFDILAPWLDGAIVLDLFTGTGTIGLEAISRGATLCCFAERDGAALARLRRNIETLGAADRAIVWAGDVYAGLAKRLERLARSVDVAFVDPPYAQSAAWEWPEAIKRLFGPIADVLASDGLVVLRTGGKAEVPETVGPLAVRRVKQYGDMHLTFLGLAQHAEGGADG